jgi:hypothetical protein
VATTAVLALASCSSTGSGPSPYDAVEPDGDRRRNRAMPRRRPSRPATTSSDHDLRRGPSDATLADIQFGVFLRVDGTLDADDIVAEGLDRGPLAARGRRR